MPAIADLSEYLPLTGGTVTGELALSSTGSILINGVADVTTNYQRLNMYNNASNVLNYDLQKGGTGTVGYHNFCIDGVNKLNVQATTSQFYVNLLAGTDNFYTLGRKSATPYRFSDAFFGTSIQVGAAENVLPAGALHVVSTGISVITSVIECISGQTANAVEVRKSDASVVLSVSPSGSMVVADTIAQRNSTTAQKTEVYNTYTSSTVYERAVIDWVTTTSTCRIGTEKGASGGTARDLALVTDATVRLTINATTGVSTFANEVVLAASTTSLASLNIPHGSAPTSPVNGDIWTTTGGQFARLNGVTHKIGGETRSIGLVVDGGGSAITTGIKSYLRVPYDCVVTGWSLLADQSGSIVIDVWKDTYANYPPTVADTIAGTEKPTLSSATKNEDTSLSSWTTALSAGDVLGFNVDSVATVTRIQLSLNVRLT